MGEEESKGAPKYYANVQKTSMKISYSMSWEEWGFQNILRTNMLNHGGLYSGFPSKRDFDVRYESTSISGSLTLHNFFPHNAIEK